jgi:GNAT superfamily N-acetyltransferase
VRSSASTAGRLDFSVATRQLGGSELIATVKDVDGEHARHNGLKVSDLAVRRAEPDEAARLTEIAVLSKGHWHYDQDFMVRFASVIAIDPQYVRENEVWVLERVRKTLGFYALLPKGDTWELDHLWLLPGDIGKGFGRMLFEHAVGRAIQSGARHLEWEAEPHAVGFYRRMGGAPVRPTTSSLGRALDVFRLDLGSTKPGLCPANNEEHQ